MTNNYHPDPSLVYQFAEEVVNFSSEYGTAKSVSYVAANLAGPPRIYSRYGDFQEAFVLRTYGPWWQVCPSAKHSWRAAHTHKFRSRDFVELRYKEKVVPSTINIYETYHPGAVVRVLVCNSDPTDKHQPGEVEWITLWSGPTQCSSIPKVSRIFSPELKEIDFATNLIRLEFNSEECGYYTELDAVELVGKDPKGLKSKVDRAQGFEVDVTARLFKHLTLADRQLSIGSDDEEFEKWGYFGMLPDEVIQLIFSFLDITSLCQVAQTCSLLFKNAYDPHLYTEVDLQPYWNTVDDVSLESLVSRCSLINRLNLSWTGGGQQITEGAVCKFLLKCGRGLLTLRLSCCQYVGKETMTTIAKTCQQLQELDLQCCSGVTANELMKVCQLPRLRGLNLYNREVSSEFLSSLGRSCPLLEHLNLGSVQSVSADGSTPKLEDTVSLLKNLKSLDLWRCRFARPSVLTSLGNNCPLLEELDIGWCHGIDRSGDSTGLLLSTGNLKKLKKLLLTAARSVCDRDLVNIATHCPELEQLDILGTGRVTFEGLKIVCGSCPKLEFFDVSFCNQISDNDFAELKSMFPKVCFKKSFQ